MTRQFKILPTPPKDPSRFCYFMLGFGYDAFCNDYKVVRIVLNTWPSCRCFLKIPDFEYSLHVWMYSANEDPWKEIEVPKTLMCFNFYRSPVVSVFLRESPGVLYFQGFYELLAFDFHDEVFRVYPYHIPGKSPIYEQNEPRMSNLLNFEGSLAMIYDESIDDAESLYSLWTLDVDCGNASWSKQFNLDNSLKNDCVALYLGDGMFLVVKRNHHGFGITYYYYNQKLAKKFLPKPGSRNLYEVVKYNESLVSLKGVEQLK
ncbi:uncharacterized protein LOC141661161 [Apium graveolens]|uniref:uncharacterized protein LOC141661159 n=1 Tax=Apium graveolens TaxID=4045 RepID=UPI003D7B5ABF